MSDSETQGITRRDLLKRGAVLGGAVAWAVPVVNTLGMGKAYANTASPVGKDISYIGINVTNCNAGDFFVKWEEGEGWEDYPGAAPECADKEDLAAGVDCGNEEDSCQGFKVSYSGGACAEVWVPADYADCDVTIWVKAGSSQSTDDPCNKYTSDDTDSFPDVKFDEWNTVCSSSPLT